MSNDKMWNDERDVPNAPEWAEDLTFQVCAAIVQGGCSSGAYMPAVTYYSAAQTMGEHGDEVLEFIENHGELPPVPRGESWSGIAVFYLSTAVELFASQVESDYEPLKVLLDFTSDSCAVMVTADEDAVEALGDSICGESFEQPDGEGDAYAMVGEPRNEDLPDDENDEAQDAYRKEVLAELDAAGIDWTEV